MPVSLEQQREAHAEYKITLVLNLYACAYVRIRERRTINRHKMDTLYPVEHSSLLSPETNLKVAKFHDVRTERNKRLLICLLPSADDVQTSPAQVHGAKVVIFCEMCKCLRRKLKDYCIIQGFARMRFGANRQRGMDGVRSE